MNPLNMKVGQKYRVLNANSFNESLGNSSLFDTHVRDGDVLLVTKVYNGDLADARATILQCESQTTISVEDIVDKSIVLSEDVNVDVDVFEEALQGASENVPPAWASSVPEDVKVFSQAPTGTPQEILDAATTCLGISRGSVDTGYSERLKTTHASEVPHVPLDTEKPAQAPTDSSNRASARFMWQLIEGSKEYNGHKQLDLSQMSFTDLQGIVLSLGEHLSSPEVDTLSDILELRLCYNGIHMGSSWGASVYQLGYWAAGEHHLGHQDRLLFGVDVVTGI